MTADLKELLEREARRVPPTSAPIDSLVADGYGRLRRRRLGAIAAAAVLAVLAAFGPTTVGWIGDDGSTVDRPAGEPSWGPYRAGNTVYLGKVEVSQKKLADRLVEVPDGVVFSTQTGKIMLLTRDGEQRTIGNHAGQFPELASDPASGWVTWLENGEGSGDGEIVVYDTTDGRLGAEVDRLPLDYGGPRKCGQARTASFGPFSVDGDAVYYCTGQGDFVWHPTARAEPEQILPVAGDPSTSDDYLLDVREGMQVVLRYGDGRQTTEIMPVGQTAPTTTIDRNLFDGFLSHDARYLAGLREARMNVYDSETGERITPDYLAGEANRVPLAMTFTDDGDVAYALIDPAGSGSSIVTCALPEGECETLLRDVKGGVFLANQRHQ